MPDQQEILTISEELRDFMPPVKQATDDELERQLAADGGPADAIVVWEETGVILDGYRRYKLCQKHGYPYKTRYVSLKSIDEAKMWMVRFQLARRNLTSLQRATILQSMIKSMMKADGCTHYSAEKRLVEYHGISSNLLYQSKVKTKLLERMPPDVKRDLVSSNMETPIEAMQRLASLPADEQRQVVSQAKEQGHRGLKAVVGALREDWSDVDKKEQKLELGKLADPKLLAETQKQFGIFIKTLHALNRRSPNPVGMVKAKPMLDGLGLLLASWKVT